MVLNLLKIISNHNRLKNSDIKILSIKNKFGKLRVHLSEYNDYLDGVLDAFEEQSFISVKSVEIRYRQVGLELFVITESNQNNNLLISIV